MLEGAALLLVTQAKVLPHILLSVPSPSRFLECPLSLQGEVASVAAGEGLVRWAENTSSANATLTLALSLQGEGTFKK